MDKQFHATDTELWGMMMHKVFLPIFLALALCLPLHAADTYVGTVAALTNAVATASSGDTVWVSNGTYQVNLTIGSNVTVRSVSGVPANVIFNGNASDQVAVMQSNSWLIGCTVTNGLGGGALDWGGGIRGGSVSNCLVTGNAGVLFGGGGWNCVFYNSIITKNSAGDGLGDGGGGGYACTFFNCVISYNTASAASGGGALDSTIYNSTIISNSAIMGGGGCGCLFYNCTLTGNTVTGDGDSSRESSYVNSVSWGNTAVNGTEHWMMGYYSNSCGNGFTNAGSTTNNPMFISTSDLRLQSSSPCINAGDNNAWAWLANYTDLDGNQRIWPQGGAVDMGAYEFGSKTVYPVLIIGGAGPDAMGGTGTSTIRGHIQ